MRIFELIVAGIHKLVTKVEDAVQRVEDKVEKVISITDIPQDVLKARLDAAAIAAIPKWGQKLDWERSTVDLMKLVELDSSLEARKELAMEFNPEYGAKFKGDPDQNVWLHEQVMHELAKRGFVIPQP